MNLLPEIRGQLLDAAFGAAEPRPSRPRRRPPVGHLAVAASVVVSLVVAAVFVLSVHGSAAPPSGTAATPPSPAPAAWVKAVGKAYGAAQQRDRACRQPTNRHRNQRFLTTAPPRTITSIFSWLASPPPAALRVTVPELRALDLDANGIYARYAWQGHADGVHYYLVPAAIVGATKTPPARCYREMVAVFRTEARSFPASQRAAAIAYAQQLRPEPEAGVSVVTAGWGSRGESSDPVWRLAQHNTNPVIDAGSGGDNNSTTTPLLVTDEVASVTATYRAQSYPGRVPTTFSVTKRPVRNFVIFHLSGAWDPPQLIFRSRTGAVIARRPNR
jgi:hypothetical protein